MTDPVLPDSSDVPRPRPARWRRVLGRLAVGLMVLGALVTALAWLLPFDAFARPGWYDAAAAVAFFTRVFTIPMAVGWAAVAVLAWVGRRRGTAAACALTAVAWGGAEAWVAWPRATNVAVGPTFSVASFNLNKDLRDASAAVDGIRRADADFVVLQELSPHAAGQVQAALAGLYPHTAVYPDTGYDGMAVLSKTPVVVTHPPDGYDDRDLEVRTTALGRELLLTCVHLAPPQWTATRRLNRRQVGLYVDRYAAETRPALLVGDFNFSPLTPQAFALRKAGFRDVQLSAGHGRGTTWPAPAAGMPVPRVRIDTAYARGNLKAVRTDTLHGVGSDHLPVKTAWQWGD